MNGGGSRVRLAGCVLAAFAVAVAWAGAAAPAWPAVHAAVAGVGSAGSWGRGDRGAGPAGTERRPECPRVVGVVRLGG
jgi:hypothetical protein